MCVIRCLCRVSWYEGLSQWNPRPHQILFLMKSLGSHHWSMWCVVQHFNRLYAWGPGSFKFLSQSSYTERDKVPHKVIFGVFGCYFRSVSIASYAKRMKRDVPRVEENQYRLCLQQKYIILKSGITTVNIFFLSTAKVIVLLWSEHTLSRRNELGVA